MLWFKKRVPQRAAYVVLNTEPETDNLVIYDSNPNAGDGDGDDQTPVDYLCYRCLHEPCWVWESDRCFKV